MKANGDTQQLGRFELCNHRIPESLQGLQEHEMVLPRREFLRALPPSAPRLADIKLKHGGKIFLPAKTRGCFYREFSCHEPRLVGGSQGRLQDAGMPYDALLRRRIFHIVPVEPMPHPLAQNTTP